MTTHRQGSATSSPSASRTVLWLLLVAILAAGCGGNKKRARTRFPAPPPQESARTTPDFPPDAKAIWTEVGLASWYGPPYHNRRSASGEIFDMHGYTAAHKTLPLHSVIRVTNLTNGKSVVLRVNDRGPFIGNRIVDLSLAAAKEIDVWRPGVARVRLEVLSAPKSIESGGRWAVQVGAFKSQSDAADLKERLKRRYSTAQVIQFTGPTGDWVRVRPLNDDKDRAHEVARYITVDEGGVFLVRLD